MLSRLGDLKNVLWLGGFDGDAFFVEHVSRRCRSVVRRQPTLQWRCSVDSRQPVWRQPGDKLNRNQVAVGAWRELHIPAKNAQTKLMINGHR